MISYVASHIGISAQTGGVSAPPAALTGLHIGNVNLDLSRLSIEFATWSIGGAALAYLIVFVGRTYLRWRERRARDNGIAVTVHTQINNLMNRYAQWPLLSAALTNCWEIDPAYTPFVRLTGHTHQPYKDHGERLSMIFDLVLYRRLTEFYETDRHFDTMQSALIEPAFLAMEVRRRLRWLSRMDELAVEQIVRARAITKYTRVRHRIGMPPPGWRNTRQWRRKVCRVANWARRLVG